MADRSLIAILVVVCCFISFSGALRIAAFNAENFSPKKFKETAVLNIFVKIAKRYDIILLQELEDKNNHVAQDFLAELNSHAGNQYNLALSPRLGRSAQKEQYGFYYKKSKVTLQGTTTFPDPSGVYERPPFIADFSTPHATLGKFTLVGLHTRPEDALEEIMTLKNVLEGVKNDRVLILGDLNADCSHLSRRSQNAAMRHIGTDFVWLNDKDTSMAASDCALDRFVASTAFVERVKKNSVHTFRFDEDPEIKQDMIDGGVTARDISDHYPIEMEIS